MGKLFVVPTPIGNLEDITQRAISVLQTCDLIAAEDTRHTQKLLNAFNINTKMISYHKFNEKKRSSELVDRIIRDNINIALVSDAGTPCISDPGYEIVKCARENGVEVIGIAGASALPIALSISGIDTKNVAYYGFLSKEKNDRDNQIRDVMKNPIRTFVLFESPKRVFDLLENINRIMPNVIVCVCNDITKYYEKSIYGLVGEVIEVLKSDRFTDKGEYTIVGYKEDYINEGSKENENILHSLVFEKIFKNRCTLKEAISEIVEEKGLSKNEVYRAALDVKEFLESYDI
ncbi:16S rRNA (cytidine(1402)-2'-O)-methyltransferase [Pseudomonas aeruginosa]|nr:16S rRNA (cytidine(1402)-2'-O)-methyltransferase [Pseudomonas aeruginosa]